MIDEEDDDPNLACNFMATPSTIKEARLIAPDWDIDVLVVKYRSYFKTPATDPQRAFIGFVRNFTKDKKPS